MADVQQTSSITQLNSFLRGEISAVETYEQALETVKSPQAARSWSSASSPTKQRVQTLKERIIAQGGTPSETGGAWAAFAKTVEGGAKLAGEKAAIQALEAGEDHGLADYRKDIDKLEPELRQFVSSELLPAQEQTHRTMSQLKHAQA